MSDFKLKTAKYFDGTEISYYTKGSEIYMGSRQLMQVLGYKYRGAIDVTVAKKPHLREPEFSIFACLPAPDGREHDIRIFTKKGMRELASFSHKPDAEAFKAWLKSNSKQALDSFISKLESFIGENFKIEKKVYPLEDVIRLTGLGRGPLTREIDSGQLEAARVGPQIWVPAWALRKFLDAPIKGGTIRRATFFALKKQEKLIQGGRVND